MNIVLVWGNQGSPNFGVSALTDGFLTFISSNISDVTKVTIFGNASVRPCTKFDNILVEHKILNWKSSESLLAFARCLKKSDEAYILNEGDSFSDIYGTKRWLRILATNALTVLCSKRSCYLPQTIGPFSSRLNEKLARFLVSRSHTALVRDSISEERFRSCGVKLSPDIAFLAPTYEAGSEAQKKHEGFTVGVNVSGLLMENFNGNFEPVLYVKNIVSLIEKICREKAANRDVTIVFLPHVISETGRDGDNLVDYDLVKEAIRRQLGIQSFEEPEIGNYYDFKVHVSGCDAFIGSRMHAVIGAITQGIPVYPITYSPKFEGTLAWLGVKEFYAANEELNLELRPNIDANGHSGESINLSDIADAAAENLKRGRYV